MATRLLSFAVLILTGVPSVAIAQTHSVRAIHLTVDTKATGKALFPGFRTHSVWNGLGVSSQGNIYVAVSNHPGDDRRLRFMCPTSKNPTEMISATCLAPNT